MSKKRSSGQRRPAKGLAVGHLFPVHPTGERGEGWLVGVTPEEGNVVVLPNLDRVLLDLPKALRTRLEPGVFWLADERLDLDKIRDAIAEIVEDDGWEDVTFCEDCFLADAGKGCGALGDVEARGFAPRPPPPPVLDADAVADMASMLLEADEDGLAFELVQAAFARFCALKPRPAAPQDVTMTLQEAADVLELELPCNQAAIDSAFRIATSKHHPDVPGGDEAMMKRVIAAKRRLVAAAEASR